MTTNYHVPLIADTSRWKAAHVNAPFAQLDEAITNIIIGLIQVVTPADNIAIDWSDGSIATVLLDRATTTFSFSGAVDGQRCILICTQDGTGGREIAFGAEVRGGTDLTIPPILTAAINKEDYLGFIYRTSTTKYDFVSFAKGY